jgi:enamine deaminase RidA (YjgF/YER057c/UK114 family)
MGDVVKVTIFVTDIAQRGKVWQARREFFTGHFPASTLVQVAALAEPAIKVEIEAIAILDPIVVMGSETCLRMKRSLRRKASAT